MHERHHSSTAGTPIRSAPATAARASCVVEISLDDDRPFRSEPSRLTRDHEGVAPDLAGCTGCPGANT
jgi:hypothetical protein